MGELTVTKRIDAPADRVFDAFIDLERAPDRIPGIIRLEKLTDGPVGVGTRFRETRMMFRREATEEMEFTAFEPGRSYTVECESCGWHYTMVTDFEQFDDATEVRMRLSYRPMTLVARLMTPLGAMMIGPLKKCLEGDMEHLRRAIESGDAVESVPADAPAAG